MGRRLGLQPIKWLEAPPASARSPARGGGAMARSALGPVNRRAGAALPRPNAIGWERRVETLPLSCHPIDDPCGTRSLRVARLHRSARFCCIKGQNGGLDLGIGRHLERM